MRTQPPLWAIIAARVLSLYAVIYFVVFLFLMVTTWMLMPHPWMLLPPLAVIGALVAHRAVAEGRRTTLGFLGALVASAFWLLAAIRVAAAHQGGPEFAEILGYMALIGLPTGLCLVLTAYLAEKVFNSKRSQNALS